MTTVWSRRVFVSTLAAGTAGYAVPWASAQQPGVLERVRKAGVVRIGITNGPPYSALKPDGSVDGVAPTIVRLVMERLGVPKVEAFVAPYGQLIPGLQAGRWDIIGADLSVTKARCEQVAYADPFTIDHAAFAYLPGEVKDPPRSIKETGQKNVQIGMLAGTYMLPFVQAAQTRPNTITIFPDTAALLEGLYTKRVQIAFSGILILRELKAKNAAFEIIYPMPDDWINAASAAFRPGDTDLIEAFQAEYRKMKKSGEAEKIITSFGFDVREGYMELTADQACKESLQ